MIAFGVIKKVRNYALYLTFFMLSSLSVSFAFQILTIGDSITRGSGFVEGDDGAGRRVGGYQPYLESYLAEEGKPSAVYNWGISGETSYEGLSRIDSVLATCNADYILIMEGANDVYEGISSSTTAANLSAMALRASSKGVIPIIATITPNTRTSGYDTLVADSYNPRIEQVATNYDLLLADHYAALRPQWATYPLNIDGLHPNLDGHQIIAETWLSCIIMKKDNMTPIYLLLLGDN